MSDEETDVLADDPWPVWPDGFAATPEDVRALLVLSALRGITPRRLLEVAIERGTAAATLAWIRAGRAGSENDRAFARTLDADAIAGGGRGGRGPRRAAGGAPGAGAARPH